MHHPFHLPETEVSLVSVENYLLELPPCILEDAGHQSWLAAGDSGDWTQGHMLDILSSGYHHFPSSGQEHGLAGQEEEFGAPGELSRKRV